MQEEIYSLFVAYVQSEMYYTISIANDKNTYKYNAITPNPSTCCAIYAISIIMVECYMIKKYEHTVNKTPTHPPPKKTNNFHCLLFPNLQYAARLPINVEEKIFR